MQSEIPSWGSEAEPQQGTGTGVPQSGGQAAKFQTESLVAFVRRTGAPKFAPLFVISKFRNI